MQANYVQRLRFIFSKEGPTRFIGHLDLARTLERAFNRARIPLAYTQGYNPRPRMQIASALPLGFTSEGEIADIWLLKETETEYVHSVLNAKMAPGIEVHSVEEIPLKHPALQSITREAIYAVTFFEFIVDGNLQTKIDDILTKEWVPSERRGKVYNLRELILDLRLEGNSNNQIELAMHLRLEEGKTGRPDEVLRALALDPLLARIHRTSIILENQGSAVDIE